MIHERDPHFGAKAAARNDRMRGPRETFEVIEQALSVGWRGGSRKAGACSLAGVGSQGELRHQQQATADVRQRAIHPVVLILKHPITEKPLDKPLGVAFDVVSFNANQGQQTVTDLADHLIVDDHPRFGDPLNESDQVIAPARKSPRGPWTFPAIGPAQPFPERRAVTHQSVSSTVPLMLTDTVLSPPSIGAGAASAVAIATFARI